ncbi:MAG: MFS transporter [Arachnia sp.]
MLEYLKRWWPLVAILALAFNLRPVAVSVGPVLADISADIGLDGVTAGLLTALPTVCFAAFGALAPWVSQRLGVVPTVGLALGALVVGQVGRLTTHSPIGFLALSAFALAGMALANVLMPTLVRMHYPGRVGLATALYSLTLTLGVTTASVATVPLAHALGGWRSALGVLLVGGVAAFAVWAPLLVRARRAGSATGPRVSLSRVARTPLGWALAVLFGIQSAQAYSIFGWLPSVYRSAGLSEVDAGFMLGIATGVGIVPAFAVPAFVSRMAHPNRLFLGIMAFLVAGYAGLLSAPSTLPWLWATFLALGTASFPLVLALFGIRARTPAATAALSGFAQSVGYGFATLGPLSFGVLHGATGSWTAPIWFQLALCVPMTVAGLYSCRPLTIEDQLAAAAS